ncbi:helix-turn-helix domain-containing protein (plasmid) [Clostridium perfringens]
MIGDNIKKLRLFNDLTLKELSKLSGVGVSTISEIESGKISNPKATTLNKIAKVLEVDINTLLGKDETANRFFKSLDDPLILETMRDLYKLDKEDQEVIKNLISQMVNKARK